MKYNWLKQDSDIYGQKENPVIIDIPKQKFLMLKGCGEYGDADFSLRKEAITILSSYIRDRHKFTCKIVRNKKKFKDYIVFPLEVLWRKDTYENAQYTLMIRQPDFVSSDFIKMVKKDLCSNTFNLLSNEFKYDTLEEGLCVQQLYSIDEDLSFVIKNIDEFIIKEGYVRDQSYKIIYLDGKGKRLREKAIVRFKIMKAEN